MAKAPPAFQFYPSDFVMGTLHLDHEAIACYLLLLCFQWTNGHLPNDRVKLARICRFHEDRFGSIWAKIEDKFEIDDDGSLYNVRLESIRDKQLALSQKRASAGRKGGQANASDLLKQKHSKGSMKIEDRKQKSNKKKKWSRFDEFWSAVPNKTKKQAARAAYEKAASEIDGRSDGPGGDDPEAFLIERMAAFSATPKARGKYCPHPTSWLNAGCYDDDPATWQRGESDGERLSKTMAAGNSWVAKKKQFNQSPEQRLLAHDG